MRRTGEVGGRAPPETRFLIGLARPLQAVLRDAARPEIENGLRTRFERSANVSMRNEGTSLCSRRRTGPTGRDVASTIKAAQKRCCGPPLCTSSAVWPSDCAEAEAKWRHGCGKPVNLEAKPHRRGTSCWLLQCRADEFDAKSVDTACTWAGWTHSLTLLRP